MPRKHRRLLAGVAVVALVTVSVTPRPAKAEILDTAVLLEVLAYLQTYVVPILETIPGLPGTLTSEILGDIQAVLGDYSNSYLIRRGIERFRTFFPDIPTEFTADAASLYSVLRNLDRKLRANEAMDTAAAVITDVDAAQARIDGYLMRNELPLESLAGIGKLGNQIAIEEAGSLKELTALTAQAAQLEADQRIQEDWQRRQHDAWLRNHYGDSGYWAGERRWSPETMAVSW